MSVTIYHNPRCTKSRLTLEMLREKGIEPTIVEYLDTPPSKAVLKDILAKLGMTAAQVIRKKEAGEESIDVANLSEDALIDAMNTHPRTIERPIVVNGDKAAIGRPPENVLEIL